MRVEPLDVASGGREDVPVPPTVPLPARIAAVVGSTALLGSTVLLGACSATDPDESRPIAPLHESVDLAALATHRSPYLGDASRVTALTAAVDVGALGDRTLALATERRPYVLTIDFASLADGVTPALVDQAMTGRAALLLATIDNADEVRWTVPDGGTGVLSRADADALAGTPVAGLGTSADGLADLVERLED